MESTTENCFAFNINPALPIWEVIATITIISIIIIITIVGNILVILCVSTYQPLKKAQNVFIVSLAATDLSVAITVMPISMATLVMENWTLGPILCKIWLTSDVLFCTSSILTLCAIGLDRYWAITDPLHYAQRRTLKLVLFMVLGVWIISAIISSPPLFGWNDWNQNATINCSLSRDRGYIIYSSLGSFYIPLFIMIAIYGEIFIVARKALAERTRRINSTNSGSSCNGSCIEGFRSRGRPSIKSINSNKNRSLSNNKMHASSADLKNYEFVMNFLTTGKNSVTGDEIKNERKISVDSGIPLPRTFRSTVLRSFLKRSISTESSTSYPDVEQCPAEVFDTRQVSQRKSRISINKEWRAARTLGIIMGIFVICWLPFFLMYIIVPFKSLKPSLKLEKFITWLGFVNSALNPFIYTTFNIEFRRAFKKLLRIN